MGIRRFSDSDAEDVSMLVRRVFREFVTSDFSDNAAREYIDYQSPQIFVEFSRKADVYVFVADGQIAGVIEGNGIDKFVGLFVDAKYQRKGVARQLYSFLEDIYVRKGASKIRISSSLFAVDFYRRMGFVKSRGVVRRKGFVYQPMVKRFKSRS